MEWSARPDLELKLQIILQKWELLPRERPFFVAYSGGSDSTALLVALVALGCPVRALHVDHGWHAESRDWARFCVAQANALGVSCMVLHLPPETSGEGPEDRARRGRYALLAAQLQAGDYLLTAQHQQDQSETFFLQLLRGTGIAGLSGMPQQKPLGAGVLLRPFLQFPKQALLDYLQEKKIPYISDPANQDPRYDRTRVREQLLPLLENLGWPHAVATVARTAENLGDVHELVDDWFALYWDRHQSDHPGLQEDALSLGFLQRLSPTRQRMFLRGWLQRLQCPLPSRARLEVLQDALMTATAKSIQWEGGACRIQGKTLYLSRAPEFDDNWQEGSWDISRPLPFRGWECRLLAQGSGEGVSHALLAECAEANLYWRRRQNGERSRMANGQHRTVKNIMLEAGIPPEWRANIPLLWDEAGHLLCIPGYYLAPWVCAPMGGAALCLLRK
ncbi:tRNA lysidine(34) synthetase TilS [Acidithiobacillus sp.]|uniref:tRNA lysidine(34) synthetase TilS n=1 Tax=Acidithiobacillus sp. TaxID=1872118 RepID=UPI003D01A216